MVFTVCNQIVSQGSLCFWLSVAGPDWRVGSRTGHTWAEVALSLNNSSFGTRASGGEGPSVRHDTAAVFMFMFEFACFVLTAIRIPPHYVVWLLFLTINSFLLACSLARHVTESKRTYLTASWILTALWWWINSSFVRLSDSLLHPWVKKELAVENPQSGFIG